MNKFNNKYTEIGYFTGVWPSGKAQDFDSRIASSILATPAKDSASIRSITRWGFGRAQLDGVSASLTKGDHKPV